MAQHLAELVRPFPGDGERTNPARTRSADCAHFRICRDGQRIFVRYEGYGFGEQKTHIGISQRIIFKTAIALVCAQAWIQEDRNCDRHRLRSDQVVEYQRHSPTSVRIYVTNTVLKNHQCRRLCRVVLRRNINASLAGGSREHAGIRKLKPLDAPVRHVRFKLRIRPRHIIIGGPRCYRGHCQRQNQATMGFGHRFTIVSDRLGESKPETEKWNRSNYAWFRSRASRHCLSPLSALRQHGLRVPPTQE